MPTLSNIKKVNGIAGQYSVEVDVQYPDEPVERLTFVGSTYGGPIVMCTPANPSGVFVSTAVTERIGSTLDTTWVERFFEGSES